MLGFFLFPFILGKLGNEVNGIWQLIATITAYFGLLELGITASITKMIAEHSGDRKAAGLVVRNAFYMFSAIGVVILLLGLALLPFLGHIFHLSSDLLQPTHTAYLIVLATMALTFPTAVFAATFAGHQEYSFFNTFIVTQAILNAIGTVVVLSMGYGIVGLAVQGGLVSIVIFIAQLLTVRRRYGITVGGAVRVDWPLVRHIFAFSKWIFLMNIAIQVVFYTDNVVLGIFSSLSAITFYQVALKPNNFLRNISGQLLTVVMPASAELKIGEDTERIGRLLLEATRITSVILVPFVIVLVAWGHDFINLWVGPHYLASYPALIALSVGIFATSLAGASSQILVALDRPAFLAKIASLEAVLNLIASIILVKPLGILGVAIGTTAPTCITAIIIAMPYAARLTGVSPLLLYRKMIEPLLIGVVFALAAIGFNHVYHFTSFLTFLLAAAILFGVFVAFTILIDARERHIYTGLLRKAFNR